MNPSEVGKFILKLRKDNNLTQADFADMFGVTYQAVSKWETGKNIPDLLIIKEICKKFNIDINEILGGEKIIKKKRIFVISLIAIALVLIGTLIILNLGKNEDFEFKTLSSNCSNFKINGSLAYNKSKSHIYISKIEYCGGDDITEYKYIECILYESIGNVDTKIDSYESASSMKLEEFLKDLTFQVDNYAAVCNESKIFLQIFATDKLDKVTSYKIPLNYTESCTDD